MTGVIKKILKDKNFGFIRGTDNFEYFFHKSALKNAKFEDLREGMNCEFEDNVNDKGRRAEDVFI